MATQIDGTAPTVPAVLPPDETLCVKCGMAVPEGLGNVCKSSGVQCKLCTSVYQLLYRHLGSMPAALQSFSATQQKEFFKQSGSLLQSAPKNGRWSLVKGAMVGNRQLPGGAHKKPCRDGVRPLVCVGPTWL